MANWKHRFVISVPGVLDETFKYDVVVNVNPLVSELSTFRLKITSTRLPVDGLIMSNESVLTAGA